MDFLAFFSYRQIHLLFANEDNRLEMGSCFSKKTAFEKLVLWLDIGEVNMGLS